MTIHTITVLRDADPELMPEAEIHCPGVTDTCAEWVECQNPECAAEDDERSTLDDYTAHDQQHRYFDEQPSGYWAVRSGFCYAENHGDAEASEFAEREKLGAGRHNVLVEVDDSTVILTLADSALKENQ
jgi:hypothetical protein